MMFFGSIPALVTPFAAGRVDEAAFRDLVEWQIDEGSERRWCRAGRPARPRRSSADEHHRLIAIAVEVARGRVPVIAGCGSDSTRAHAIAPHHGGGGGGRDAALRGRALLQPAEPGRDRGALSRHRRCVGPADHPLQRPRPHGRRHQRSRRWPSWRELPNVVGVKDATGNLARVTAQRARLRRGIRPAERQ